MREHQRGKKGGRLSCRSWTPGSTRLAGIAAGGHVDPLASPRRSRRLCCCALAPCPRRDPSAGGRLRAASGGGGGGRQRRERRTGGESRWTPRALLRRGFGGGIRLEKLGRGRIVIVDGCYAMKRYPKSSSTHKI